MRTVGTKQVVGEVQFTDIASDTAVDNSIFSSAGSLYQKFNNVVSPVGAGTGTGLSQSTVVQTGSGNFTSGSELLLTLPANAVMMGVFVDVTGSFDGETLFDGIGTTGTNDLFVGSASIQSTGLISNTTSNIPYLFGSSTQEIHAFINKSGGAGTVWTSGGNLNENRSRAGAFGGRTAAVVVAGFSSAGTTTIKTTTEYNGTSWAAGNDASEERNRTRGCGTSTAGLVAGGFDEGDILITGDDTEEYNGTTWSAGGDLVNNTREPAVAGLQTDGLRAGGTNSTSTSEEYNGASWSSAGALSISTQQNSCAGASTSDMVLFGNRGGGTNGETDSQDYNGTSWSTGNSLAQGVFMNFCGTSASTSTAYSAGGRDESTYRDAPEYYNGTTWSSSGTTMLIERATAQGHGVQGDALINGGYDNTVTYQSTTEELNPLSGEIDQGEITVRFLYQEAA